MEPMLKKWNKKDPVDAVEKCRNAKILELQGTENHWIKKPSNGIGSGFGLVFCVLDICLYVIFLYSSYCQINDK